ncbi:hypothetical protein D6D28_10234 [Aureobasidium pullulans]|uniref:F-box domain-containing protein n=1 Tax=Aureobasidium pullulans TaxID=5580 RepID=A0A4S8S136_AURPU|nr:hypothetical protein D6D28_10234 [Aureobasidium pullulans]
MSRFTRQGDPVTPSNRNRDLQSNQSSPYRGSPKSNAETTSSPENRHLLGIDPMDIDDGDFVSGAPVSGTASAATTLASTSKPLPDLLHLPDELKLMVIGNLEPQSKTTFNLALTVRELKWMAMRQHWSTIGTKNESALTRLRVENITTQQNYVGLIQDLTIRTDLPVDFSQCRFNSLQKLVVRAPDESAFDLDLSTFLGPSLTDINLKLNLNRQGPCIINFLPVMNRSPSLKSIQFGLPFHNTHPDHLLKALESCPRLETVRIHSQSEDLIDEYVWRYLATNHTLRNFLWTGLVDVPFLDIALENIPHEQVLFSNVTHLYLTITSDAAAKLFPHLQNLTSLALVIRDHGDILESVARLNNLNNLHIEYDLDTDLTVALLAPLRHMNLTRFVLRQDNRFTLDGSAIPLSALPNLFGSHATMERLEFAWQGSLYFDDNAQDVLWALGRVYPKVNWCSLTAASLPSNLGPSNAYPAYPPMWPSLRRLDLWEMIEPDYADNYANYCTHFANQIILHLPNVSKITVAHKKPFSTRIRRECSSLGKII